MRILILARNYPFPPDTGASRRTAAFVSGLAERGHSVTLLALQPQEKVTEDHERDVPKPWRETIYSYQSRSYKVAMRSTLQGYTYHEAKFWYRDFKEAIDRILVEESYDVVIVNFLTMSRYLEGWIKEPIDYAGSRPLFVLDQHNLDEVVWQRHIDFSSNIIRKNYARNQLEMIKRLQRFWLPKYDVICSVSQGDLEGTQRYLSRNTSRFLIPNGVDVDYFQPNKPQKNAGGPPTLVFVAAMDVAMNQDAAIWFVKNVFPLVRQSYPEVQFRIVGRAPSPTIQKLGRIAGINVTGTVVDVRDYYREADICVVPLRMGGGTKLKTLEAMAMGMPVVSTTVGVQGLEVENGIHYLLAEDASHFAERIIELLENMDSMVKMGNKAKELVRERYSWNRIVSDVDSKLQELLLLAKNGENNESGIPNDKLELKKL